MTEDLRALLAAAIDGELSPAEQGAVQRLLCESEEARSLFARLQSDSIRLKNLSKLPPANLVERVLAKLPKAEPASAPVRRERSRKWVVVGLAASVLLAIASGSFLYFTKPGGAQGPQTAQGETKFTDVLPKEALPPALPPAPPSSNNVAEVPPTVPPEAPGRVEEIPLPRVKGADVFVAPPLRPIPPLDRLIVRVPLLVSVSDLERDDAQQKLLDELGRDPAYRIDLFAKDAARGAELFQAAAKAANVNLFADALALDRMKKKQATAYAVFADSLAPADIRDLFARLSAEDGKNPQRVFDSLHASPAVAADQTALKDLLGTDPGLWKRPAGATAEPKPISAGTGDELTKSLTAKAGDKAAVLLSFTPAAIRTNPAMSKELKEFLARRGERKASAVPILIVIRQPSGG